MTDEILKKLQTKLGAELQTNYVLAPLTWYKIGGPAEYFLEARSLVQAVEAIEAAKENGLPLTVLGQGSNVLVNSGGVNGLVIRMADTNVSVVDQRIKAGAGLPLRDLVETALQNNLAGLEWAAGIPGTVGGAVYGNAGAYQRDISSVLTWVKVYDGQQVVQYPKEDLGFSYRESDFKGSKKGQVILEVEIILKKSDDIEGSRQEVRDRILERTNKLPMDKPNAGCIFTNVKLIPGKLELFNGAQGQLKGGILEKCPIEFVERGVIPAAYLIELADLKGYTIGGIQVSPKHANFLVNTGQATSDHLLMMISYVKQQVRDKFGVQLHEEMQLIGF